MGLKRSQVVITREYLEQKNLKLIPVSDLIIEKDETKNTAYDFTVEDFYTFLTEDGVSVFDCMAFYIPLTDRSKQDILDKILITNNLVSPANGEPVATPTQDTVLGIYSLTKDNDEEKREYKKIIKYTDDDGNIIEKEDSALLTEGQIIFNELLPKNYPIVHSYIEKGLLNHILNRIQSTISNASLSRILDKIKTIGFAKCTLDGYTLSLKDIYNPELVKIANNLSGNYQEDIKFIKHDKFLHSLMKKMPFAVFIDSGARGSWLQAQQLVFSRGYVADHNNQIRPNLIKSSLVQGLTPDEFFDSCWGCRKGLLDTATSTGDSGFLTRQLIYSTQFCKLGDVEDCFTNDYLNLELMCYKNIDGERIEDIEASRKILHGLKFRWYLDPEVGKEKIIKEMKPKQEEEFIKKFKFLKLRSPIFCKSDKICKKCYGEFYKKINTTQIGIIATHSISEKLTQLVLRTFHLSGVASSTTSKGGNNDIISDMSIINTFLHKPQEYTSPYEPENLVKGLFQLLINHGSLYMVHVEVLISCMIWYQNKLWRTIKNRDHTSITREWNSILKIPYMSSWLVGCAFSDLKGKIIDGLVRNREDVESSLSSLFRL